MTSTSLEQQLDNCAEFAATTSRLWKRERLLADELAQALIDGMNDGNGLTETGRSALANWKRTRREMTK